MDELEARIQSLCHTRDLRGAASKAIEGYGPEIFGFLLALLRDEGDACEVFSQTCEDLWVGFSRFEGRCSTRTWLYMLARHAAARFRRSSDVRLGRRVGLSELSGVAASIPSSTPAHLRAEVKNQVTLIRDALPEDDRALLVLRVDRALSWREIAIIFSTQASSDESLRRAETRLRKRFQLVKEEIRARARKAGLLASHRSPRPSHTRAAER